MEYVFLENPVKVDGLFQPHYVTWLEQQRIEQFAPDYLRNIVWIITETGLRIRKEFRSARTDQVDFHDQIFWIPGSENLASERNAATVETRTNAGRSKRRSSP